MQELLLVATSELARFLHLHLQTLSPDWWEEHVTSRLTFQQQRFVSENNKTSLETLDFAALLRIFDQNWYELSHLLNLPREGRSWVKELQTVRNKWAHLSTGEIPQSEIYRDADTLSRLFNLVAASPEALEAVESTKSSALSAMAWTQQSRLGVRDVAEESPVQNDGAADSDDENGRANENIALFKVGELVALRSNQLIIVPVLEVIPGTGECRYVVFQDNKRVTYYERQLQSVVSSDDERVTTSITDVQARLTALNTLSSSTANLFALHSGRIQFVPYQYRPVLKLIRSDRPRLLIADEVGVGKTIEAGLIIKELRARMDLASVLIICPKALVAERKWFWEMKRFDEQFTVLDGQMLRHCLRETDLDGEWPEQYAKAILPFSLFDSTFVFGGEGKRGQRKLGLVDLDPLPKFDLVIVDEAHHIRNPETFLHQGIRLFCENAEAVIFLTATPVQLGSNDLFTLLNVLRPDLVIDRNSFANMAEPNSHINDTVQICRAARHDWQNEAIENLKRVVQTEWGRLFLRESPAFQHIYDRLNSDSLSDTDRIVLIRDIEELYTFSRLINRTRRRDIGEFTTRKPETVTIEFTPAQKDLHDGLLEIVARILAFCHGQQNVKFMMTTIRRQAASCLFGLAPLLQDILNGKIDQLELLEASDSEQDNDLGFVDEVRGDIANILEQASNLDPYDPKIEAFLQILNEKSHLLNNKALIFSTFRHTLSYLTEHMRRTDLRYGLIHGDVPDHERSELRRRFALPKQEPEAIDVLLSSEVGCEGLDFQFCDFLINYDLPWNPMRIEQRIGRIDRYGQKSEAVAIVNFVTPGTVDADIYERCLWRIGVFQHAIGGTEEILGEITQEIHDIADSFNLTPNEREARLQQLSDNGIRRIREVQDLESNQAEFFGLNVPNQSWEDDIQAAENHWLSPNSLRHCVTSYLNERLGKQSEYVMGEKSTKTLRLSQEARNTLLADYKRLPRSADQTYRQWEKWLKGSQPVLSITFDQNAAAEDPSVAHLSVMHPLVRQAAFYLRIDKPVYTIFESKSDSIPEGQYRFALYRWIMQGVKQNEELVAIASDPIIESEILDLISLAKDSDCKADYFDADFDDLDARHHEKWTAALADHIEANRLQVDHRIQSLTISHRARCTAIADQIERADNEKINLMKQGELVRANADFDRRMGELQVQAGSGDIHATAVLFGILRVSGGGSQ